MSTTTADPAEEASSARIRRELASWASRGYAIALLITLGTALAVAPDVGATTVAAPSVVLAAVMLLAQRSERADIDDTRLLVLATVLGAVTFTWVAWRGGSPAAGLGLGVCAGLWLGRVPRRRRAVATAGAAVAVLALATPSLVRDDPHAIRDALMLTTMTGIWVATVLDAERQRVLFRDLERVKDAERELEILRERFRFAADLHDVQGHSLHVIRLKAAVAARLHGRDPERVAEELEAIGGLAVEAIEQARTLANATHRLSLATELLNARALLEAAGVRVDVVGPPADAGPDDAVLALVLREATTNVLRHARPRSVTIDATASSLRVRNDGALAAAGPQRGLLALRDRVEAAGGRLHVRDDAGCFEVRAELKRDRG